MVDQADRFMRLPALFAETEEQIFRELGCFASKAVKFTAVDSLAFIADFSRRWSYPPNCLSIPSAEWFSLQS